MTVNNVGSRKITPDRLIAQILGVFDTADFFGGNRFRIRQISRHTDELQLGQVKLQRRLGPADFCHRLDQRGHAYAKPEFNTPAQHEGKKQSHQDGWSNGGKGKQRHETNVQAWGRCAKPPPHEYPGGTNAHGARQPGNDHGRNRQEGVEQGRQSADGTLLRDRQYRTHYDTCCRHQKTGCKQRHA